MKFVQLKPAVVLLINKYLLFVSWWLQTGGGSILCFFGGEESCQTWVGNQSEGSSLLIWGKFPSASAVRRPFQSWYQKYFIYHVFTVKQLKQSNLQLQAKILLSEIAAGPCLFSACLQSNYNLNQEPPHSTQTTLPQTPALHSKYTTLHTHTTSNSTLTPHYTTLQPSHTHTTTISHLHNVTSQLI